MEWVQNNIGSVLLVAVIVWMFWSRVVKPKMVGVKGMSANAYDVFKETAHTLLDVRSLGEWHGGHAVEALHIPLNELEQRMHEIAKDKAVVVICASGMRSISAASVLGAAGYAPVYNYSGGMGRWRGVVQ